MESLLRRRTCFDDPPQVGENEPPHPGQDRPLRRLAVLDRALVARLGVAQAAVPVPGEPARVCPPAEEQREGAFVAEFDRTGVSRVEAGACTVDVVAPHEEHAEREARVAQAAQEVVVHSETVDRGRLQVGCPLRLLESSVAREQSLDQGLSRKELRQHLGVPARLGLLDGRRGHAGLPRGGPRACA